MSRVPFLIVGIPVSAGLRFETALPCRSATHFYTRIALIHHFAGRYRHMDHPIVSSNRTGDWTKLVEEHEMESRAAFTFLFRSMLADQSSSDTGSRNDAIFVSNKFLVTLSIR
jgi:hypothetical protein